MSRQHALGSSAQLGIMAARLLLGVASATSCFKDGQLYVDYPATDRIPNGQYTASPYICQTLCQRESWCDHFVWKERADYSTGVLPHGCWLLNGVGVVTDADVTNTGLIVNGPKVCPLGPEAPTNAAQAPALVGVSSTTPVGSSTPAAAAASMTTPHSHATEQPVLVPLTTPPSKGVAGSVQSAFKGGPLAWVAGAALLCTVLLACFYCLPGARNLPSKDHFIEDVELSSKDHLLSLESTELTQKVMPEIRKAPAPHLVQTVMPAFFKAPASHLVQTVMPEIRTAPASHVAPSFPTCVSFVTGYLSPPQHLEARGLMMALPESDTSDHSLIQGHSPPSMQHRDLSGYSVILQSPAPPVAYRQPNSEEFTA